MKRLSTFALLARACAAAGAQSNITLFGVLDANVRVVNNGIGSLKSVSASGVHTSRFGFGGIEDPGGGLKAGF